jgi:enterochelin esterase-like enzyme
MALYPPGHDEHARLPVCIALHGRGGSHTWVVEGVHLDQFLADQVTNHGASPFVIVSVDGGDSTNWHRRADGEDPLAMVTNELVPRVADRGLAVDRVGLWGWSLGGYGALRLAAQVGSSKVAAVVAASPALWTSFGAAADGVFDNADDFAANDVRTMQPQLAGLPLWIDCGSADPFAGAVDDFRASVQPTPGGEVAAGCHDSDYWTRVAPGELDFLAGHLAPLA